MIKNEMLCSQETYNARSSPNTQMMIGTKLMKSFIEEKEVEDDTIRKMIKRRKRTEKGNSEFS